MSIPEQSGDSFDFCVLFRVYFIGKGAFYSFIGTLRPSKGSHLGAAVTMNLQKKDSERNYYDYIFETESTVLMCLYTDNKLNSFTLKIKNQ